jgi:TonB family protein
MTVAAEWFVYFLTISALLALGAHSAEAAMRGMGRSGRWIWFAALLLSVLVPLLAFLDLRTWSAPIPALPPPKAFMLSPIVVSALEPAAGFNLNALIRRVWACASLLFLAHIVIGCVRLQLAQRRWRREQVDGVSVLVTEDVGPAVFGLGSGSILMPEWALSLERRLRQLLLLHEREHLRAGDPRLLLGALALVAVVPWNPLLWWQLRRLKLAVEMDCDARVLRAMPDARNYGALLLEVGRRRGGVSLVVAFSEPVTFLERRIRMFTRNSKRNVKRALLFAPLGIVLGIVAVSAQDPSAPAAPAAEERAAIERLFATVGVIPLRSDVPPQPDWRELLKAPSSTPFTQAPALINTEATKMSVARNYPPLLKDGGIGGQTILWFLIDEKGVVRATRVYKSSGYPALDEAALKVAGGMVFSPAKNREIAVPVWVQIPIDFALPGQQASEQRVPRARAENTARAAGVQERRAEEAKAEEARKMAELERLLEELNAKRQALEANEELAQPVFTPMTQPPSLVNGADVEKMLQRQYPPLLRDAGIGGQIVMWFNIDEAGNIINTKLFKSSGYTELDQAAVIVAKMMKFRPAMNRDRIVPVWVQIPITFSAK